MKLKIIERIVFGKILPQEGDYKTLVIKNDIVEKVQIGQEEMKEIEFKKDGEQLTWNTEKAKDKEVVFTELETELIKTQLYELDKQKKLDDNTLPIYKLFNS